MTTFQTPKQALGDIDAAAAARLLTAASDVALVVDDDGIIRDLAFGDRDAPAEIGDRWLGRPWVDTVSVESRPKVEAMLREADSAAEPRCRQVNHPVDDGPDLPIRYCALRVSATGAVIAVGRNLQGMATLQQQLIEAQQSLERDYWRLRQVETRYRLLFRMASEPIVIVDAASQRVVEANPAADHLLGSGAKGITGRDFPVGLDEAGARDVQTLLAAVRGGGGEEVRARSADGKREFVVSASLVRQDTASLLLVRLSPTRADASAGPTAGERPALALAMETAPDGIVVTDSGGHVIAANLAFLNLAQLATEEQARGQSLDQWLGRPGVDLNVMLANLRQHAAVHLFATTLRDEYGTTTEVEISASALNDAAPAAFGFIIRNVGRRVRPEPRAGHELPRSVEQLTELVGRVPLKELVRESTDLIERLCIEAALEITSDNRASAAEMLGLSRQSLYVKLRRYGLMDAGSDNGSQD